MGNYTVCRISQFDTAASQQAAALLSRNGLLRDENCSYTAGVFDGDRLVATGSCLSNSLRCLAVDSDYQGEGLLNIIVGHLIEKQYEQGNFHLFLYTKCDTARFFSELGFYEIARVANRLVFMENRADGFERYLASLQRGCKRQAAIVMNANPFTLGHYYLAERASRENDTLHLFVVSENRSFFSAKARFELVRQGVSRLKNVILHPTESYMISSAVFPSYFLKSETAVIESQAALDAELFKRIAAGLSITRRYLGDEPTSKVTALYNKVLTQALPDAGIECVVLPRLKVADGRVISASTARLLMAEQNWQELASMLPDSTIEYLKSNEGAGIIKKLAAASDVAHY